jgi:hypothetical protein
MRGEGVLWLKPRHIAMATLLRLMARSRQAAKRKQQPGTFTMMPYGQRYGHRLKHIGRQMRLGPYRP